MGQRLVRQFSSRWLYLGALVALLVAAGIVVPLATVVVDSLTLDGGISIEGWTEAVEAPFVRERLGTAAALAAASTAIGVTLGFPASFFLSRRGLLRPVFLAALLVPVAVPSVVIALGVRELTGDTFVPAATIVGAQALAALGITVWLVSTAWGTVRTDLIEAASVLGADRTFTFWNLAARPARRMLRPAIALAFLHGLTAVGSVVVLGGDSEQTLEAALIARAAEAPTIGIDVAAATVVQFVTAGVAGLIAWLGWRWPAGQPQPAHAVTRIVGTLYLLALSVAALAPLGSLVRSAITVDGVPSAEAFTGLLDADVAGRPVTETLQWTVACALASAVIATLVAWGGVRTGFRTRGARLMPAVLAVTFVVAPLGIAVGLREVTDPLRDSIPLAALLVVTHAVLALPLAVRVLESTGHARRRTFEEAAILLGEPPSTARAAWTLSGGRMALAAAFLFALAISLCEVGATSLLATDDRTTAGAALLDAASGQVAPSAFALAAGIALLTSALFLLAEAARRSTTRLESP